MALDEASNDLPTGQRRCDLLARVLLLAVLVAGLATFTDFGTTVDQPVRASTGENWWRYLFTGDPRYIPGNAPADDLDTPVVRNEPWLAYYGALFDMIGAAFAHVHKTYLGGVDDYYPRSVWNFLVGWLGLVGCYLLAQRMAPQPVPLFAVAMLVLVPRFYGHCFNNPKDIPFATTFVWAVYGLVRWLQEPGVCSAMRFALCAALCTAVRPFGLVFLPLGVAAGLLPIVAGGARVAWLTGSAEETFTGRSRQLMLTGLFLVTGCLLTIAFWPILWVRGPWVALEAATFLSQHQDGSPNLFFGQTYDFRSPPPSYILVWVAITLPLVTLVLTLAGLAYLLVALPRRRLRGKGWVWLLVAGWAVGPMLVPFVRQTTLYSTVRHFLFLMPPVCLLAALGLDRLLAGCGRGWKLGALAGLVGLAYADVFVSMVRLHPYEQLYFSPVVGVRPEEGRLRYVGALPGARGRFPMPRLNVVRPLADSTSPLPATGCTLNTIETGIPSSRRRR